MKDQNLGKKAVDKITGFEGVIVGKIEYLTGCNQYGICPKAVDSKILPTEWFDEGRLIIEEAYTVPAHEVKSEEKGGLNRDCPK